MAHGKYLIKECKLLRNMCESEGGVMWHACIRSWISSSASLTYTNRVPPWIDVVLGSNPGWVTFAF